MILSREELENIAAAVIKDFNQFYYGENGHDINRFVQATPIEKLASEYLGLHVSFARLSTDGSLCGLTAYTDTEYQVEEAGQIRSIPLKKNQILLDESYIQPANIRKLNGKRRFTLAHECAHQILFQLASDAVSDTNQPSCCRCYAERKNCSLYDMKTREDWNEWQANVLGAALLMPQREIERAMWYFADGRPLSCIEGCLNCSDQLVLALLCQTLGVSKRAAMIRLRELGYIKDYSYTDLYISSEAVI